MFQLAGIKVTDEGDTVPSVKSFDVRTMVTLALGMVFITIVNVACVPSSAVNKPLAGVTEIPAISTLLLVTDTSEGFILL